MVEATLLFTGNYDVSLLSSMRFAYLTGHPRALPLRRIEITEHVSTIVNSETTSLARRWLAIKNCFQHIPAISSHVPAIATTFISTRIRQSSMKPVTKGHVIFCELPVVTPSEFQISASSFRETVRKFYFILREKYAGNTNRVLCRNRHIQTFRSFGSTKVNTRNDWWRVLLAYPLSSFVNESRQVVQSCPLSDVS